MVILVLSVIGIIVTVNRSMKPLEEFTQVASDLADGKMDQQIVATSEDEIGDLADVLERLRLSLKAAMDRLSR